MTIESATPGTAIQMLTIVTPGKLSIMRYVLRLSGKFTLFQSLPPLPPLPSLLSHRSCLLPCGMSTVVVWKRLFNEHWSQAAFEWYSMVQSRHYYTGAK